MNHRRHQTLAWVFITCLYAAGLSVTATAQDTNAFLWASQLGGNKGQTAYGMAVDPGGNIYVTGIAGHKSYQSIGTHLWHSSGGEMFLAKLSPAGKVLWRQTAGGSGIDAGIATAVAPGGSVYVGGYFSGKIKFGDVKLQATEDKKTREYTPADAFLARYDTDGKLLWVRQAGGPALDQIYAVATDKEGNAYVTGYFEGKATFGTTTLTSRTQPDGYHDPDTRYGDFFVAKYDPAGKLAWVRQAGDTGLNTGQAIAADASGNVYVTGRFEGAAIHFGNLLVTRTDQYNFVAKYDRDGNILWAQPTAGVYYLEHANNSIAVDASNNVFVAGSFIFTQSVGGITLRANSNKEIFLAKYDTDGRVLWCKQAGGEAHDQCNGLALDAAGNAYMVGHFNEIATFGTVQVRVQTHEAGVSGYGTYIACYRPDGDLAWVDTPDLNTWIEGVAVDNHGQLVVHGGFRDFVTLGNTTLKAGKDFWGNTIGDVFIAKRKNN